MAAEKAAAEKAAVEKAAAEKAVAEHVTAEKREGGGGEGSGGEGGSIEGGGGVGGGGHGDGGATAEAETAHTAATVKAAAEFVACTMRCPPPKGGVLHFRRSRRGNWRAQETQKGQLGVHKRPPSKSSSWSAENQGISASRGGALASRANLI